MSPEDPNAARERERVAHNRDPETDTPYWRVEAEEIGKRMVHTDIGKIAIDRLSQSLASRFDKPATEALGERIRTETDLESLPTLPEKMATLIEEEDVSVGNLSRPAKREIREQMVDQFEPDQLRRWAEGILDGADAERDPSAEPPAGDD